MFIELDFNSNEAIYMQLRNQIILGIAQDKIKNGESLPSVRQLAEDIGVNMHTVNKAYALLRNDGYLKLDRRKGAVVCARNSSKRSIWICRCWLRRQYAKISVLLKCTRL